MIAKYINRKRVPALVFKVEDMVILDSRNIKTTRLNKSLDYKNLGPYRIKRAINNIIYELDLSEGMNIYPVFHS